jgi:3-carboxy-cis,cis-muconate cycloisomerase
VNHYDRGMSAFDGLFVPAELRAAVSPRAWLEAMLDAERALSNAGAAAGIVPEHVAKEIADACDSGLIDPGRFDFEQLVDEGRAVGNIAEPLVRALAGSVGDEAARYVHRGATSQDIVDTASMLVSRRALALVLAEADDVAAASAALAHDHRDTLMVARTILQHAVPTTFGVKAAGWLTAVVEARMRLEQVSRERLAAQLGGAAGTLAGFDNEGVALVDLYARELELQAPTIPWHTNRTRIAELGAALAITAGVASKIALDLVLLAQTEVAEVAEGGGTGRSSTMPQKRNPVGSTLARANARLAAAHATVLLGSLEQEHERAAGAWQAEWDALVGALAHTGGALHALAGALESLEVDAVRMRQNLDLTGGLVLAERVAFLLMNRLGRAEAQEIVREAATSETSFRDALLGDPRAGLEPAELDAALDPSTYLGSSAELVDRALAFYESSRRPNEVDA